MSLFYSFKEVAGVVVDDQFPHAIIKITPVETHLEGEKIMIEEIKPTLPQMRDMLAHTKNERQRAILGSAIQSLTAAMK